MTADEPAAMPAEPVSAASVFPRTWQTHAVAPPSLGPWSPTPTMPASSMSQPRHIDTHSFGPPLIFQGLPQPSATNPSTHPASLIDIHVLLVCATPRAGSIA